MKTTVEALKALYIALGGQLTDTYAGIADGVAVSEYVLIPDVIEAISQVVVKVPAVTAEDNGKILKVANGEWAVGTDEITA